MKEIWEVDMWKNVGTIDNPDIKWVTESRTYDAVKDKEDFDLHDVPGLRQNAKFVGFVPDLSKIKSPFIKK